MIIKEPSSRFINSGSGYEEQQSNKKRDRRGAFIPVVIHPLQLD